MDRDHFFGLIKEAIQGQIQFHLNKRFGPVGEVTFKFEIPPESTLGHLALACFPFAKPCKSSPAQIAGFLAEDLGQSPIWESVRATGPYLNFLLNPVEVAKAVFPHVQSPDFGNGTIGKGKKVMLEYSSPNTNKPLHLGHGRNNLLGMSLAKLLETSGFEVVKTNLINDRGIHICKSMLAYQNAETHPTPESAGKKGDKLVGEYYVLYDKQSKENPALAEDATQMLQDWEAGEPEVRKLWETMNRWVIDGFTQTYKRLGCEFDKLYFESQTFESGRAIVQDARTRGLCQTEDNGALSIDLEDAKLGKKILLRGDGTSMYITQDLGTTVKKFEDFAPLDASLFVVGNEQDLHFKILFETLKRFGYEWSDQLEHISYGMITLPEGKMKSREGTVVDLDDLMDSMHELAKQEILSRENFDPNTEMEQIEFTAESLAQGALKFFILRSGAAKEIQFNPKESLSFEGATGPYLQYTHARISSLLAKGVELTPSFDPQSDWNRLETNLLVSLSRFYDALFEATQARNPASLCGYLSDLCRSFNKYYYDTPILKVESTELAQSRLGLSVAVQAVIAKGLRLLGIEPLTRM